MLARDGSFFAGIDRDQVRLHDPGDGRGRDDRERDGGRQRAGVVGAQGQALLLRLDGVPLRDDLLDVGGVLERLLGRVAEGAVVTVACA